MHPEITIVRLPGKHPWQPSAPALTPVQLLQAVAAQYAEQNQGKQPDLSLLLWATCLTLS